MVEKRKPTYDLAAIQKQFGEPDGYRITVSAQDFAFSLGLDRGGVVALVQSIERRHFYKSMTTYRDHRIWQDVYHAGHGKLTLYVKFTLGLDGYYLLISLKEK
ncbi:MAG: type II toxin-antitoxin system MqsR family toxin [Pseudomonadota bacterium]